MAEVRAQRGLVTDPSLVFAAAARLLESRARSSDELRQRLVRAGYGAGLVQAAIERLVDLGLLDDSSFARGWVESRDRAHPRATRVLRGELLRKGVDPATIAEVMEARATSDGQDIPNPALPMVSAERADRPAVSPDEAAARRLLARNARSLERVADSRKRWQRAYGLLARNGFDPDLSVQLVREAAQSWATAEVAPDDPE